MATASNGQHRQLGLTSAVALVMANMIGVGVFTTSGFLLADLGSPVQVVMAWFVGGLIALMGALSYGALARAIPESGGEYLFLSKTLHPAAGYLAGWISLLVGFSAPLAAAAHGFGAYIGPWFPDIPQRITGTILLIAFAAIHSFHVKKGALVQNISVGIKFVLILAFMGLAVPHLPELGPVEASGFSVSVFAVSLVWISFSYSGWNAAVYIAGEVRNPERNLPLALLIGTLAVTGLYMALNAVFVYSAPIEQLAGQLEIGRLAAEALGGPSWANAMSLLVAIALITSVSSMTMAGPRVYARMASDQCLPACFRKKEGPPVQSILLQLAVSLILLWSATFEDLLTYIGFTLSLSTAAAVAGLMGLKQKDPENVPVPGWPWIPVLFLLTVTAIALFTILQRPKESLLCLGALSILFLYRMKTSTRQ